MTPSYESIGRVVAALSGVPEGVRFASPADYYRAVDALALYLDKQNVDKRAAAPRDAEVDGAALVAVREAVARWKTVGNRAEASISWVQVEALLHLLDYARAKDRDRDAEVESLRAQLAEKTARLTELTTADGTNRWVAEQERESIVELRAERDRLRGELEGARRACERVGERSIEACRLLREMRRAAEHGPTCGVDNDDRGCDCGYVELIEELDAFLSRPVAAEGPAPATETPPNSETKETK
jgi:chromosome segregation ATPase